MRSRSRRSQTRASKPDSQRVRRHLLDPSLLAGSLQYLLRLIAGRSLDGEIKPNREPISLGKNVVGQRPRKAVQEVDAISARLNCFETCGQCTVLARGRVGWDKGRSFVVDAKKQGATCQRRSEDDGMAGFIPIAVQNHIGQCFFHAEMHGEARILIKPVAIGDPLNPRLDPAQLRETTVEFKPVVCIVHERVWVPMGSVSLVRMRFC